MSPGYLMGLDFGGRSGRCVLVNIDSGRVFSAARAWAGSVTPGSGGFGFEFNPQKYWRLLIEAAREALAKSGASPDQVLGIAATSMRHSLVLMDASGHELLSVPNRDGRASDAAVDLEVLCGEELNQRGGHWPMAVLPGARLKWAQTACPELVDKAVVFLQPSDWIAFRLSGEYATEPTQAGESMFFDLQKRAWSADLIEKAGLPYRLFPRVAECGERIGALTPTAAEELGLKPGIPILAGAADTMAGLLGVGALQPGTLGVVLGSTTPLQWVVDQPLLDPEVRLWTGQYIRPGRWVLESNSGSMGEALEWMGSLLFADSPRPLNRLSAEASKAPFGAGGIISSFGVQVMNARQMGLPVGNLTLSQMEITPQNRRANLSRATLEGLAYSVKINAEQIASVTGSDPTSIKLCGGMTRCGLFCQIIADTFNRPVDVSETPEASGIGAAVCAGIGAGVFTSLEEGVARLAKTRTLEPTSTGAFAYADLYTGWKQLFNQRIESDQYASGMILQGLMSAGTTETSGSTAPGLRIYASAQLDDASVALLKQLGDVTYANYRETMEVLTGDALVEKLQGYNVLITEVDIVDIDALRQLPDLRVVVACRGNAVNVDIPACTAAGVLALNTPGRNADAVADLALGYMLMLSRKLAGANQFLRQPGGEAGDMGRMGAAFSEFFGHELFGRTVGLVGLGAVGRGVARRLRPFGTRVLVYDPYLPAEEIISLDAEPASLEDLLATSDIISLHAAVTDETRGMLGAGQFAAMKPGAMLVNTARAALVDQNALLDALRTEKLAGYATDVYPVEPPASDDPLLALPNVIATPHIGGNTAEVAGHQGQIAFEDLGLMAAGQRPHHILNPQVLERFTWTGPRLEDETLIAELPSGGPAVSDLQVKPAATEKSETIPAQAAEISVVTVAAVEGKPTMSDAKSPKEQMEKILHNLTAAAGNDGALNAYAAKNKATQLYTITDLGLEFYIAFKDGKVVAGTGAPDWPAEVKLKMKAEILDGVLGGTLSGNKAAMSGKMSFSGDVRTAMGMQRIQNDLVRLYTAARQEAGGIDFSTLAAAPSPAAAAARAYTGTAAQASVPATVQSSLPEDDPRRLIFDVTNELYATQLITATGGNISHRIEGKNEAWITPSAIFKGNLRPDMMVRVDFEGRPLDPDGLNPSSEKQVHTEIYKVRPDVEAVVHAHAPYATMLMLAKIPFMPITVDSAFFKEIPVVPFIMPGTSELAKAVAKALGKGAAVFMQNHGVVVVGSSLRSAANKLEAVERTSQLILGILAAGKKPTVLPKEVIKMLQEVGDMTV